MRHRFLLFTCKELLSCRLEIKGGAGFCVGVKAATGRIL